MRAPVEALAAWHPDPTERHDLRDLDAVARSPPVVVVDGSSQARRGVDKTEPGFVRLERSDRHFFWQSQRDSNPCLHLERVMS
jgi:hypothetical protein